MRKIQEFINKTISKETFTILTIFLLTGIAVYFVNQTPIQKIKTRSGIFYEKAVVVDVMEEELGIHEVSGTLTGMQKIKVEILSGNMKGDIFEIDHNINYMYGVICKAGTRLIVHMSVSDNLMIPTVYTYDRSSPLFIFIGIFCFALFAIGGKKGIRSLIGLLFTFVCVIYLFIPLLYQGWSPIGVSILLTIVSTFVTLILISGWNSKSISAIIGTIICVFFAGITSIIAGFFLNISDLTLADTDQMILAARFSGLNPKGILFASLLIASLGAIIDMCMSIATSLNEIYINSEKITQKELFRSGMNIGRDMMGTMSNTLILAFSGGFLSTIVLLASQDVTINELLSMPSIVTEIIQGLSGSMGIFLAVPVVSFVSAKLIFQNEKETSGLPEEETSE